MTQYDRATLHLGDGTFEMAGNLTITEGVRTGYLVSGAGSSTWSFAEDLLGAEDSGRKGIYLEAGGGAHSVEIEFTGWRGATDADDNPLQWGNTGDPDEHTAKDATGEKALAQIQCLTHYMNVNKTGSLNVATLEFGERSEGGLYGPMDVAIEGPNMTKAGGDGEWFNGTMTCLSTRDLEQTLDSAVDPPW